MKYSSGIVTDLLYLNVFNLFDESEILKGILDLYHAENETTDAVLICQLRK